MGQAAANPRDVEALEKEFRVWRCAQTLLKPCEVRIPFANKLGEEFPISVTRVRRDFLRFLALIEAHCLLYQYQREVDENGYLVATLDDFIGILPLANVVLTRSLKEISPAKERVLTIIQQAFNPDEWFSVKELVEQIVNYEITNNYEKTKFRNYSPLEFNNNNELYQKDPSYEITKANIIEKENKRHRTLQNYIKGFYKDGLLEWNEEKGPSSMYRFSINTAFAISQYPIFTPKFLESLGIYYENGIFRHFSQFRDSTSNSGDKEAKGAQESNGSQKKSNHAESCDCPECFPVEEQAEDFLRKIKGI